MGYLHGIELIPNENAPVSVQDVNTSIIGIVGWCRKGEINTPIMINSPAKASEVFGMEGSLINAIKHVYDQTSATIIALRIKGESFEEAQANILKDVDDEGKKAGIKCLLDSENLTGQTPKILCAPWFTDLPDNGTVIVDKLVQVAGKLRAIVVVDGTDGNYNEILAYKNSLNKSERTYIVAPWVKLPVNVTEKTEEKEALENIFAAKKQAFDSLTKDNDFDNVRLAKTTELKIKADASFVSAKQVFDDAVKVLADSDTAANKKKKDAAEKAKNEAEAAANVCAGNYDDINNAILSRTKLLENAQNDFSLAEKNLTSKTGEISNLLAINKAPQSGYVAGLIAKVDAQKGFFYSASSNYINGILGTTRPIEWNIGDEECEANKLNEQGITTIIRSGGYKLWGNRTNAAKSRLKFLTTVRICDAIDEAILRAHQEYLDQPMNKNYFITITDSVNAYLRLMVSRGALLGGKAFIDQTVNTPETIADGKATIDYEYTEVITNERLTFRRYLTNKYISEVFK